METNRIKTNGGVATDPSPSRLAEQRPGLAAIQNQKFRIPGDQIAKAVEALPDPQRDAVKWAAGYCRDSNLSCEEFGQLLTQPGRDEPYSGDSVYAVFTGRREAGSLERFCKAVDVFRRRVEETAPRRGGVFVETSLTRRIWAACRSAFERKRVTFIYGESQIGKTTALEEYQRQHNHGETYMVRMPTRGALSDLLYELAIRLNISPQLANRILRRRILECFDDRTLLIVDECQQCLSNHYADRGLAALEFLREIHDRRKCGLVLVGTNIFRDGLRVNRTLRQLWLRGIKPLQLPSRPSTKHLAEFAKTFGLAPAEEKNMAVEIATINAQGDEVTKRITGNPAKLQESVIRDYGLGRWLAILEDATDLAKERSSRMTWGRVIAAHHNFQAFEHGE